MFPTPGSRLSRKRSAGGAGGGTPAGVGTEVQYRNAGAFGAIPGSSVSAAGYPTFAGGTITANDPFTITQTWNNAGVGFTGIKYNAVVTASNNSGFLIELQRGGTDKFAVDEFGNTSTDGGDFRCGISTIFALVGNASFQGRSSYVIAWANGAAANGTIDTGLSRIAAGVVGVGNATAADVSGWIQWGGLKRVTADVPFTSTVALATVTGLSVNVAAGRSYTFRAALHVTDAAAGGVQAAIAGTATATAIQYVGWTLADNAIKAKTNATALGTAVGSTVTTEITGIMVFIEGTITVNAAGTLLVQAAQNTSNASATTIKRGSTFIVQDMP